MNKMKLELKHPTAPGYFLLLSNIDCKNSNAFYLLMAYHKSRKGGFDVTVTTDDCDKALKKHNKDLYYYEPPY